MKRRIIIGLTVGAIFLLMGTISFAQVDSNRPELNTIVMDNADDALLLAHHVGSVPAWMGPDDLEDWNVHGGDYDENFDPKGNAGDMEPENRPDSDPRESMNQKKTGTAKAQAGSDN